MPSGAFAIGVHIGPSVLHVIVPVWHTLPPGLQAAPGMHATHWDLRQIQPAGQVVQEGPQALLSLVASTHALPQSV